MEDSADGDRSDRSRPRTSAGRSGPGPRRSRPSPGSTSACPRETSSASSGRTAPGRPPRCGSSPPCCRRPRVGATVAGFDVARRPDQVRRRIGYVAQSGGSYRGATGREELVIQGRLFGLGTTRMPGARAGASSTRSTSPTPPTGRARTYSGGHASPARHRASAWSIGRRCSSSTSRRPAWTRRRGRACGTRSAGSATRARPSS